MFDKIDLYIEQNKPIFERGQLSVVLSRCLSKNGIKVQIISAKNYVEKLSAKNVALKVVL